MAQWSPASADNVATASRIRTARTTGLWYLGLAICGLCAFLLLRSQLYAPGYPRQTLAHLRAHSSLARAVIAFELAIVFIPSTPSELFFRLFTNVSLVRACPPAALRHH